MMDQERQREQWREASRRFKDRDPERTRTIQRESAARRRAATKNIPLLEALIGGQTGFWDRVDVGDPDKCWNWTGLSFSWGYPAVALRGGRLARGNRVAWELTNGAIPTGLFVCHRCDNRLCCNPAHLFLGTAAENNADRDIKGRRASTAGENNGNSKLDWDKVRAIRDSALPHQSIADQYGVSRSLIGYVKSGKIWREDSPHV